MKTWLVIKIWYGDFDVRRDDAIAAGPESLVKFEVSKLNENRTADEIEHCVKYEARTVKTLK